MVAQINAENNFGNIFSHLENPIQLTLFFIKSVVLVLHYVYNYVVLS